MVRDIAKREGIKIDEDDFNKRIESAHDEKQREAMLKNRDSVLYDILMDKVFDFLLANAKIQEVEV